MKTCKLFTWLAVMVWAAMATAEVASVSGTVRDEKGRPLQGARVTVQHRGRNEKVSTATGAKGDYNISLQGRGWQAGSGYLLTVTSADRQLKVTRTVALKDGPNPKMGTQLTPLERDARRVPISSYPIDNPGWYVGGVGGIVLVERDRIEFGRTFDTPGANNVRLDPSEFEVAVGGIVGYQFNTNQAVEVSYLGTRINAGHVENALAYSIPAIDPASQIIPPMGIGVNAVFDQKYEAEWNDFRLMYVHRFLDCGGWTLLGRGGVAGGTFDQEFKSRIEADGILQDELKETVDDTYVGPQVGVEARYRFCKHFWTSLGMDIGGMFGSADLLATQDVYGFPLFGPDRLEVKDKLDYTALRLGAMAGFGWAPCAWASLYIGYHFGFWTEAPRIDNPPVTADAATFTPPSGRGARLTTESLNTHAVTGSVTLRFP